MTVKRDCKRAILINGSTESTLPIRFEKGAPRRKWKILDCEGEQVEEGVCMGEGIDDYDVPESGRIEFEIL